MGQLRNKCVRDFNSPLTHEEATSLLAAADFDEVLPVMRNWTEWVLDKRNWYFNPDKGKPELCGNASGAR